MTEKFKMPSPEEMAQINKQRVLSDADLLRGGAEMTNEGKILPTEEQIKDMKIEMGDHFYSEYQKSKKEATEAKTRMVEMLATHGNPIRIAQDIHLKNCKRILGHNSTKEEEQNNQTQDLTIEEGATIMIVPTASELYYEIDVLPIGIKNNVKGENYKVRAEELKNIRISIFEN